MSYPLLHPGTRRDRAGRRAPRTRCVASAILFLAAIAPSASAQVGDDGMIRYIDDNADRFSEVAQQIWDYAEVGYQEQQSSSLLQRLLSDGGFRVETGVAGMPTAFVAEWGEGGPVIGILGEFDALPGINQDRVPERQPIEGKGAGHACGHHMFGTASAAAALAVRQWLEESGQPGRVRFYGTPAEEGGAGKVYMVREGLFEDVDAVLHWHPGDRNDASPETSLANKSAKFRFYGVSAHAAGAPERGRSALDGVEALNMMVNMMREHVPQETRIHYVITQGGFAPNVIPDFAEVFYYVRNPDSENVKSIFERVAKAAEGAALGTGTRMEYEVIHGIYSLVPNFTLARVVDENLREVGGYEYSPSELSFAEAIHEGFPEDALPLGSTSEVQPFELGQAGGSTDVGDVSSVVPTAGLSTATWVPGTAAHSWQAVAAGGTTIGNKGMLVAAKALALSAADLLRNPQTLADAKAEYVETMGADFVYESLVGDRDPPLDYRNTSGN